MVINYQLHPLSPAVFGEKAHLVHNVLFELEVGNRIKGEKNYKLQETYVLLRVCERV